jgi:hypothetical protein
MYVVVVLTDCYNEGPENLFMWLRLLLLRFKFASKFMDGLVLYKTDFIYFTQANYNFSCGRGPFRPGVVPAAW